MSNTAQSPANHSGGSGLKALRSPGKFSHFLAAYLVLCLGFAIARAAEQPVRGQRGVAGVRTTVNFLDLAQREAAAPPKKPERRVVPFMPEPPSPPVPPGVAIPKVTEPLAVAPAPTAALAPSPAPAASFEALGDNDTAIPPDTQGAVGPNHLMVALNTQVRIQTRSGVAISTVSLGSFWNTTGATGVFDPKLAYDAFNNRWIFTAVSNSRSAASSLLIGVSQSSDPTGNWNLHRVDVDAADMNWGDYPSLGFNKDWIVVTVRLFSISADQFQRSHLYTFGKADLYAAGPGAFTLFMDTSGPTFAPAVTHDNTLATMYLVQNFNGNFMGSGFLRISTITGSVSSEVYTAGTAFVSTPNPWASAPPGGADFAPQKDTAQKIQNNDARILNVVYRNGSLWAAHSAFLPASGPTHSVAQWWQFTPGGTVQQFGRVEDPNAVFFYAFPTIAVNARNDALLGYSSFSATQFASASYSFRSASDPPGTMRVDALLKAGEAVYFKTFGSGENRWGDYSNTVVDPVNDLDMWTIQEYASSPNFPNGDNRWGTWWGRISPPKKRQGQLISE